MYAPFISLFTLAPLFLSTFAAPSPKGFDRKGAIRVLRDGEDVGCLTNLAEWTDNPNKCFEYESSPIASGGFGIYAQFVSSSGTTHILKSGLLQNTYNQNYQKFTHQGDLIVGSMNGTMSANETLWFAAKPPAGKESSGLYKLPQQTGAGDDTVAVQLSWPAKS